MLSDKNLDVLVNIIGAVESGGQVYGKRRYETYADPYHTTASEYTITIGWACNYGSNARKLMQKIYDTDPKVFREIDVAGIEGMLSKDWVAIRWKPNSAQKHVIIQLITSDAGKKAQDELFKEDMKRFISDCESEYTKDPKAVMMYCEIRHLGGKGPVDRIYKRSNGYSLDAIMSSLQLDQMDTRSSNQVGDKLFWSRHVKCREFIDKYAETATETKAEEKKQMITAKQIIICGHGSGNPSLKNLYTYSASRYSQKAPNGKRKGIVAVRRLKAMTDAGRKKFVEAYKTILGRNIYNQGLRQYVYKPYPKTGKYYSDCSSSICATYEKIGYKCPLVNTAAIYNDNNYFESVPVVIKDGQIQNCEVLKVADCILYAGNDPSRPLQIGHVEAVYEIQGETPSGGNDNVTKGQQWLNSNYKKVIEATQFELLKVDGDYGAKTRWACLAVWKDLMNRKYGTNLTPSNQNFGNSCKEVANFASVGYGSSGTFTYICALILSAKGFYSGKMDAFCDDTLCKAIHDYEVAKKLKVDSDNPNKCVCGPEVWYSLFN